MKSILLLAGLLLAQNASALEITEGLYINYSDSSNAWKKVSNADKKDYNNMLDIRVSGSHVKIQDSKYDLSYESDLNKNENDITDSIKKAIKKPKNAKVNSLIQSLIVKNIDNTSPDKLTAVVSAELGIKTFLGMANLVIDSDVVVTKSKCEFYGGSNNNLISTDCLDITSALRPRVSDLQIPGLVNGSNAHKAVIEVIDTLVKIPFAKVKNQLMLVVPTKLMNSTKDRVDSLSQKQQKAVSLKVERD